MGVQTGRLAAAIAGAIVRGRHERHGREAGCEHGSSCAFHFGIGAKRIGQLGVGGSPSIAKVIQPRSENLSSISRISPLKPSEVSKIMTQEPFDRFSSAPISQLIGFQVAQATQEDKELGLAVVALEVDERLHNPMGRVHGGVLAALADAAMGIAFGRMLDSGQDFSTVDLQIQYMRPVTSRLLRATAKVKQRGLRMGFVECEIRDNRDRLIACSTCTCTTIDI